MNNIKDLKNICNMLYELGVTHVRFSYNGEGDSGSIEDTSFNTANGAEYNEVILNKDAVTEQLNDFLTDSLSDEVGDWYNNDGAYGEAILGTKTQTLQITNNQRITDTEVSTHEVQL